MKRFFAEDMRRALLQVKETLGPDAVIMSNKKVNGGVEIVAAIDGDAESPAAPQPAAKHRSRGRRPFLRAGRDSTCTRTRRQDRELARAA